jgi:peptide-methionine (R)-S-oxide reductase
MKNQNLWFVLIVAFCFFGYSIAQGSKSEGADHVSSERHYEKEKVMDKEWAKLSEKEWKARLSSEEFRVLREHGTERPFTGIHLGNKEEGVYVCSGCGQELFKSQSKFDSGTGWPSYFEAYNQTAIREIRDESAGMVRVEIRCSRCDGHLGHVFDDGPNPTGLRYCVNSVSLDFDKSKIK